MSGAATRAVAWVYSGVWGVLAGWFRVPREAPTLPSDDATVVESFRPSARYLRYLTFQFWVLLAIIDIAILVGWIAITIAAPVAGAILAIPALIIAVVPDVLAYVAIHLKYDTTWYVLTDRSLRIRRGIWVIHETTITFENIQNVVVDQGPLQRYFGIASVQVQTAGGGTGPHGAASTSHLGLLEGLDDAERIRDLILSKLKRSRQAGLGDERADAAHGLSPAHLEVLREIRELAVRLSSGPGGARGS